jgi:hypothetical protein
MELTSRESLIVAFALNVLAIDGSSLIKASSTELQDMAQKFVTEASKN